MNEPVMMRPVNARWDPQIRHDMALRKIRKAVELALDHPQVSFTHEDLQTVAEMMRLRAHTDDTQPSVRDGETSIRPSVSNGARAIDPNKRYRLKSTGEVVTGTDLLKRRESDGNPQ